MFEWFSKWLHRNDRVIESAVRGQQLQHTLDGPCPACANDAPCGWADLVNYTGGTLYDAPSGYPSEALRRIQSKKKAYGGEIVAPMSLPSFTSGSSYSAPETSFQDYGGSVSDTSSSSSSSGSFDGGGGDSGGGGSSGDF